VSVATLARKLADVETGDRTLADAAYMGGLLHDLGKLVFAANLGEQYAGAMSLAGKNNLPLIDVENEVFGATHAEIAAYLVALWGLPDSIVEAIALHHSPGHSSRDTFTPLTAVHAANALVHERQLAPGETSHTRLDPDYLARLNLGDRVGEWREIAGDPGKSRPTRSSPKPAPKSEVEPPVPVVPAETETKPGFLRPIPIAIAATVVLLLAVFIRSGQSRSESPPPTAQGGRNGRSQEEEQKRAIKAPPESAPVVTKAEVETTPPPPSSSVANAAMAPANPPKAVSQSAAPANPLDRLALKAIFYRPTRPAAVINERTLFIGDEVDGAKVIAIEKDRVRVSMGGKEGILTLRGRTP
jgi:hypothetical protein